VGNPKNHAITAIRSISLENMIAQSLHRAGWEIIHRATGREELDRVLVTHPEATLIAAEDFLSRKSSFKQKIIWVTATTGEHELHTELRNLIQDSPQPAAIAPLTTKVTVITTVDSGLGGSAMAINLAYESSQSGSRTLLLDFNSINPYLSRYFEIQRINRSFSPTPFGFTIGEISDISISTFMAEEINRFDHVVIDLGRAPTAKNMISGKRIHDSLARWSLQSATFLYLLARGEVNSILHTKEKSEEIKVLTSEIPMTYLFISQSPSSTKERRHLLESAKSLFSGGLYLLTSDVRNLAKAKIERAPLAVVAPKSILTREIAQLYRETLNRER
jgi:cellulose biosynthesis protein BcsQ